MDLTLSEEQRLLKESVERFVTRDYGFERRQALAAGDDGFGRDVWGRFAELGWLAIALPEEHGGLGGSLVDLAVLMEGFGRGLVVEPYLATVVLSAGLLRHAGSAEQRAAYLPGIAAGGTLMATGFAEPESRFDLARVATRARPADGRYVLDGHKSVVFHAEAAQRLIVSARTAGEAGDRHGITLFLVDPAARGVGLRGYRTVDGLRAAEIALAGVAVSRDDVVGTVDEGLDPLERVIDEATVAVAAEAVGIMAVLMDATREYLRTRKQFGAPLGSFQVLQHRVVDMFGQYALSRALVYRAADAMSGEDDPARRARAASAAKVQVGRGGRYVGQQAIQLHGGMGMTDELFVGHYFKRLSMIDTLFGNADFHLRRFAAATA